jgi:hypothetical protein
VRKRHQRCTRETHTRDKHQKDTCLDRDLQGVVHKMEEDKWGQWARKAGYERRRWSPNGRRREEGGLQVP